ncbi:hypothetical protein PtB15_5B270 [Puccinia triticina]|nr:hypothetical protein PtB15_5B270 [Puccinia triticina]
MGYSSGHGWGSEIWSQRSDGDLSEFYQEEAEDCSHGSEEEFSTNQYEVTERDFAEFRQNEEDRRKDLKEKSTKDNGLRLKRSESFEKDQNKSKRQKLVTAPSISDSVDMGSNSKMDIDVRPPVAGEDCNSTTGKRAVVANADIPQTFEEVNNAKRQKLVAVPSTSDSVGISSNPKIDIAIGSPVAAEEYSSTAENRAALVNPHIAKSSEQERGDAKRQTSLPAIPLNDRDCTESNAKIDIDLNSSVAGEDFPSTTENRAALLNADIPKSTDQERGGPKRQKSLIAISINNPHWMEYNAKIDIDMRPPAAGENCNPNAENSAALVNADMPKSPEQEHQNVARQRLLPALSINNSFGMGSAKIDIEIRSQKNT